MHESAIQPPACFLHALKSIVQKKSAKVKKIISMAYLLFEAVNQFS